MRYHMLKANIGKCKGDFEPAVEGKSGTAEAGNEISVTALQGSGSLVTVQI